MRRLVSALRYGGAVMWGSLVVALAIVPQLGLSRYWMGLFIFGLISTLLALSLVLLLGFTGQVSLGQGAFYGVGAYVAAIASTRWDLPFLAGLVMGAALAAILAYVGGRRILQLEPFYLAMATLVIGTVAVTVFNEWTEVTGGPNGLPGIPRPVIFGIEVSDEKSYAYLCILVVIACLAVSGNIGRSRVGRALRAIRADETAAAALGVDVNEHKARVFALSAAIAAAGGVLYAHYVRFISPETFGVQLSIDVVVLALVGGVSLVIGAVFGAAFLTGLPEILRAYGEWSHVIFGVVLFGTILFMPSGLAGLLERASAASLRAIERLSGNRSEPTPPSPTPVRDLDDA